MVDSYQFCSVYWRNYIINFLSESIKKKRLPVTLQDRLSEVEDLLKKGTIDEEEYKYMRKQILSKHID